MSKLACTLRLQGILVWYSNTNVRGTQQWHDEISDALQRCDWLVLVLSPDAVASMWVKRELVYSLQHDRFDGKIVPILYRSCLFNDLSWTLPQLQMVDFLNDFEAGQPQPAAYLGHRLRPVVTSMSLGVL